jgi:hypothetical protein
MGGGISTSETYTSTILMLKNKEMKYTETTTENNVTTTTVTTLEQE